ncbi:MAG: hypothetical protein ACT4PL_01760 [Phycisphaerales bacterium]
MPPETLNSADRLLQALQALPWGVHGAVALALLAGLVLWACGRAVLKPVTLLVGTVGGAIGGYLALPVVAPEAGVSPALGGVGGAIIGLLAAMLLYRAALALAIAFVGAGLCGLLAAAVLGTPAPSLSVRSAFLPGALITLPAARVQSSPDDELPGGPANEQDGPDAPNTPVPSTDPAPTAPEASPPGPLTVPSTAELIEAADHARAFVQALQAKLSESWRGLPAGHQLLIGGTTVVGFLLGALLGLILPAWSAGAVTAFAGAAIWLPAAAWLAHAAALPVGVVTDLPPSGLIVVWAVVGLVGLGAQWTGLIRAASKSSRRPREPAKSAADDAPKKA